MSEKIMRVSLADLKTARITCRSCANSMAIEVKIDRIDAALAANGECRFCHQSPYPERKPGEAQPNYLVDLGNAIAELNRISKKLGVEFDIVRTETAK